MISLPTGIEETKMEAIEIAAKSVEDAQKQAAAQFGVDKSQVTITVLEETKGLFGKSNVKVRAEMVSAEPAPDKKSRAKKEPVAKVEKPARAEKKPTKAVVSDTVAPASDQPSPVTIATQEDAEQIVSIMTSLLETSGLTVTPTVKEITGKYVNVSLSGNDVSYLVGRRGEVLNALQYLMNVILTRQLDSGARIVVDGDDYRHKRQEVLEKLAYDIAEEVKKRGEEAVLDALPAFERRVIHQVLSEFEGVVTYSEGEEPDRRVVIAPAEVA